MVTLDARLTALSSPDLLTALERTAAQGRNVTADLIALLAECDARQLYAAEGYASLFEFCVARLRLSEAQAYHRIQAARATRRFPLVLDRLREGRVTLTAVALLRQHLTEDNHREVLDWADGRGKREVELFVRRLDPKPDVPSSIRRLALPRALKPVPFAAERHAAPASPLMPAMSAPALVEAPAEASFPLLSVPPSVAAGVAGPLLLTRTEAVTPTGAARLVSTSPGLVSAAPAPRAEIRPLAPERYSLHVTISEDTHGKLRRAQDLLRHTLPTADPALVLDRALTLLVAQLERRKAGAPRRAQRTTRPDAQAAATPSMAPQERDVRQKRGRRASGPPHSEDNTVETTSAPLAVTGVATLDSTEWQGRSRYIPAAVRRAVWDRDGARCAYVSRSGVRCGATAALEYHHRVPFAEGGASTVENLALACTRHNAFEAKRWFNFDRAEFQGAGFGISESGEAERAGRCRA